MRLHSRVYLISSTVALAAIGGCQAPDLGTGLTHGLVAIAAVPDGNGGVVQDVYATFLKNSRLEPDFFATRDTCVAVPVGGERWGAVPRDRDLERVTGTAYINSLLAGDRLLLAGAGSNFELVPTFGVIGYEYRATPNTRLPIAPGEPISLEIPGERGEFPAAVASARLAEPIAFDTLSLEDGGFRITWDPAAVAGSRAVSVMRFRSSSDVEAQTFDLMCAFPDDGVVELPLETIQSWRWSPPASREFWGSRMRYHTQALGNRTTLFVISSYRVPFAGP